MAIVHFYTAEKETSWTKFKPYSINLDKKD